MAKAKNTPAKATETAPVPPVPAEVPAAPVPAAPAPVAGVSLGDNERKWLEYIVATNAGGTFPYIAMALARALVGYVEINQSAPDAEGNFPAQATEAGKRLVAPVAPAPEVQGSPMFAAQPATDAVPTPAPVPTPAAAPSPALMFPAAPGGVAPAPAPAPKATRPRLPVPEGGYVVVADIPIPPASTAFRGRTSQYPFDTMAMGTAFFVPDSDIKSGTELSKSLSSSASSATDRSKKTGEVRQFMVRKVDDGKAFGPQFAGKSGVGVWRTKVG